MREADSTLEEYLEAHPLHLVNSHHVTKEEEENGNCGATGLVSTSGAVILSCFEASWRKFSSVSTSA